ncbi:MAG: hypothetical protein ACP5J4_14340 [Anaerolineae bacterium]
MCEGLEWIQPFVIYTQVKRRLCIMKDMRTGISKRQWLLVLAAVATVIVINGIGIWDFIHNFRVWIEAKPDLVSELYWLCNPPHYLAISSKFLIAGISLVVIAWQVAFLSTKAFFQKWPTTTKYGSELLVAIFVGSVFAVISIVLSNSWVHDLYCGSYYGLLGSKFVHLWSISLVFPATSTLMFVAMLISNQHFSQHSVNS